MIVLHEDNHVLCVLKPANVPVQADESGDDDVLSMAKRYVKEKYAKPGEAYVGLVHRLDRPVAGILALARTSKAARRMSDSLQTGKWIKTYFAVVEGRAKRYDMIEHFLRREGSFSRVVFGGGKDAKKAVLEYERLAENMDLSLLRVKLITGRHHQIRVQLAESHLPIWGDMRYNKNASQGNIALYAGGLAFPHPTLGKTLHFASKPQTYPFTLFNNECYELKSYEQIVENDDFAIVYKPHGLETRTDSGDSLEARTGMTACHRLDATTAGLVLLAKTSEAERAIDVAFRQRMIKKRYECVVAGCLPQERGEVTSYLLKDPAGAFVRCVPPETPGAKEAVLRYESLSRGKYSRLGIELVTGRTHQIRVQLASLGCPVLGDDKYGSREANRVADVRTPCLFSTGLELHFNNDSPLAKYEGLAAYEPPRYSVRVKKLLEKY